MVAINCIISQLSEWSRWKLRSKGKTLAKRAPGTNAPENFTRVRRRPSRRNEDCTLYRPTHKSQDLWYIYSRGFFYRWTKVLVVREVACSSRGLRDNGQKETICYDYYPRSHSHIPCINLTPKFKPYDYLLEKKALDAIIAIFGSTIKICR